MKRLIMILSAGFAFAKVLHKNNNTLSNDSINSANDVSNIMPSSFKTECIRTNSVAQQTILPMYKQSTSKIDHSQAHKYANYISRFAGAGDGRASRIYPAPGYYDVIIHGTADETKAPFSGEGFDGKPWLYYTAKDLAKNIKMSPDYNDEPIRLFSCYAGMFPGGPAQQLADALGKRVLAPSDIIAVWESGFVSIGYSNDGHWNEFFPGMKDYIPIDNEAYIKWYLCLSPDINACEKRSFSSTADLTNAEELISPYRCRY